MAIYHLSINIISRGKGKSAVAAAAYRAAEKLTNEYDGLTHNYINKDGVLHSEIILPEHAPSEFSDRSTLWNSVEKIEKAKNSQLAREFDIALPKELNVKQNIELFREYCRKNFVDEGMCVDFAIHDKKEDGNDNIHAHVMLTMRPINADSSWGIREKKDYALDEHGERIPIIDPTTGLQKVDGRNRKQWKRCYVQTNDWNNQANAEIWRESWADMCNEYLEKNNHTARIDHRSYERQGVDTIPSIHMGVAACEMESKGIETSCGNLNREIKADNAVLKYLKSAIALVKERMASIVEIKSEPLTYHKRNEIQSRIKDLNKLIEAAAIRKKYKPIADELKRLKDKPMNILNRKSVENEIRNFEYDNKPLLAVYYEALKILPEKVTPKKWQAEVDELQKTLADNPVESIKNRLRKGKAEANKRNLEREVHEPERKKKMYEAEI
ncbi:MAG: MobA/MobL family protein [Oscillospiraceae bacterium]|jgi:ATP-dependent exoDNAse (exonuclease V) alpha subunit|nr:MobA/MobL family protein [Oscillospiraceae bacterium]